VRRLLFFQATILAATGLLATSSGCGLYNPRHGMILRGDWSLELNRVPWLNSRTQTYDESGEGGCGTMIGPEGIGPGGALGATTGLSYAAPEGCRTGQTSHRCLPGGVRCRTCAASHGSVPTMAPAQQVAHSRFHPVPTRPVFTPWNCPKTDPRTNTAPKKPTQPRTQSAPELIPTPAAPRATSHSTGADESVASAAWVFRPE
jgi:hypothetical protein